MTASAYPETIASADDSHEQALMQRIKAGDADAKQKLITGNLRHVLHSNKRYARNGARIFDLLKAGNRGLAHALDNFETEGDGIFSAYAATCIRRHIECALNLNQRPQQRNTPARHCSERHPAARHIAAQLDSCPN